MGTSPNGKMSMVFAMYNLFKGTQYQAETFQELYCELWVLYDLDEALYMINDQLSTVPITTRIRDKKVGSRSFEDWKIHTLW